MLDFVKNCVTEVFNEMGSGHTETVYEACLALELGHCNTLYPVHITRQVPVPLQYKGFTVGVGFIDIMVDGLVVELKAVAKLTPKDVQQVKKYLIALDLDCGLLINFGNDLEIVEVWKDSHGETPSSTN